MYMQYKLTILNLPVGKVRVKWGKKRLLFFFVSLFLICLCLYTNSGIPFVEFEIEVRKERGKESKA